MINKDNFDRFQTPHSLGSSPRSKYWIRFPPPVRPVPVLAFAAIIAAGLFHIRSDLTFPIPWPDEAAFLSQAIAVAERSTLHAPELNPDRDIMWMPPGYAFSIGLLFKILPFSLQTARWSSWLSLMLAFVGLLWLHRHNKFPVLTAAALSLLCFMPTCVVTGNIARMEALLISFAILGFILLNEQSQLIGLALLAATPLLHPNGVYFLAAGALWVLTSRRSIRLAKAEIVAFGVVILLWLSYGVYVFAHWDDFRSDMMFQLARKSELSRANTVLTLRNVAFLIAYSVLILRQLIRGASNAVLFFGAACFVIMPIAPEMWYEIFTAIAFVIAAAAATELFLSYLPDNRVWLITAQLAAFLFIVLLGWSQDLLNRPSNYLHARLVWGCDLKTSGPGAYIRPPERSIVLDAIARVVTSTTGRRVAFYPEGDALLFRPDRAESFVPFQATFTNVQPDVAVFHFSKFLIPCWDEATRSTMKRWGIAPSDIVLSRDVANVWYVKRLTSP